MAEKENYHDYVIKGGQFVGEFEEMYQECDNPWPETEEDLKANPVSSYAVTLLKKYQFKNIFSLGLGKGLHANWIQKSLPHVRIEGCEISETAVKYCEKRYPHIKNYCLSIDDFIERDFKFDVILLREVLWYILPSWDSFIQTLSQKYPGKHIILEITCYDQQNYGREYFDGPDDIIRKFPFSIKEILRHHISSEQRQGMILILGQI